MTDTNIGRPKARLRVSFALLEQALGLPEGIHITAVAPSDPGTDTFAINLKGPGLPLVEEGSKLPFIAEIPGTEGGAPWLIQLHR